MDLQYFPRRSKTINAILSQADDRSVFKLAGSAGKLAGMANPPPHLRGRLKHFLKIAFIVLERRGKYCKSMERDDAMMGLYQVFCSGVKCSSFSVATP